MCKKLKNIRLEHDLTVKDVAELLNISASFYYKLEQGTRNPTLKLAKEIAILYGVNLEVLF
jgi:putative transcriptional regulator